MKSIWMLATSLMAQDAPVPFIDGIVEHDREVHQGKGAAWDASRPVFPASFFEAYHPQTALDMLDRTPGFVLNEGASVRGFGGAASNVLVDGQRPTVKAGGITEVLHRISARQVERIEILRGGAEAAQAQGQTLVANVILKVDAPSTGNWSVTLAHTDGGRISPSAKMNLARRYGAWQTNMEMAVDNTSYPLTGIYHLYDADGALTRTWDETLRGSAPALTLAGSAARTWSSGTLTLNARANDDRYSSWRRQSGRDAAGNAFGNTYAYEEASKSLELGADWTGAPRDGWVQKVVGLVRMEDNAENQDYAETGYQSRSRLTQKPLEGVARLTRSREDQTRWRTEFGVEVAYNRLDSALDYAEDTGNGLTPVTLTGADTSVSELRGEAFANASYKLSPRIRLEAGLAVEASQIKVTGDVRNEQGLIYIKPSVGIVWTISARTQAQFTVRRSVDQLDFDAFAASVDSADNRALGGNAQLRPTRTTEARMRFDHSWGKGRALAVQVWHESYEGVLDYILLPEGDQALGDAGDGKLWGANLQVTLPIARLVQGGLLKLDATVRDSAYRDPLTGLDRDLSDITKHAWTLEFRQDLHRLQAAWGLEYQSALHSRSWYVDEEVDDRDQSVWTAYIETTRFKGLKSTLTIEALNGERGDRRRTFYVTDRSGAVSGHQDRTQTQDARISLTISRSF
ncbi:MAG: TonB-dependent receptor [Asticcacaulis sp.]|uniref:TonB-dependent receptor plug domain-containing protein n=1 Tax=Asticcacaulis sp. TaxID=1872648 RepID=UPI0039E4F0B6